jgi:hypothetical protein
MCPAAENTSPQPGTSVSGGVQMTVAVPRQGLERTE